MKRREFIVFGAAGLLMSAAPAAVMKLVQSSSLDGVTDRIGKIYVCTDVDGVQHRMQLAAIYEHDGGPLVEQCTLQFKTDSSTQLDGLFWVEAKDQQGEMLLLQSGSKGQARASYSRLVGYS